MHRNVLPKGSAKLLAGLSAVKNDALRGWVLAGGTGLALQLGHRVSEDFDFFRTDALDLRMLHGILREVAKCETLQEADHTLTVIADGTKVSFFRINDPFLFETTPHQFFSVADSHDIALMKLIAISSRGSRKDFVDLYMMLRGGMTLKELFKDLPRKYGKGRANEYHILKSLTYFTDAEDEPMPKMLVPFDWKECKKFFLREAQALVLPPG